MKLFTLFFFMVSVSFAQNATELCLQLTGNGSGSDAKARTKLMKITHTAAQKDDNSRLKHEGIILQALQNSQSDDVTNFLLLQLEICGGKAALPHLAKLLSKKDIGQNAIRTFIQLTPYDDKVANKLLLEAVTVSNESNRHYLLNAMSILKMTDPVASKIYRQFANNKSKEGIAALQGLAQTGRSQDSSILLKAFSTASQFYRGRLFSLNLTYCERLAQNDKKSANKHLFKLKSQIKDSEVPYLTGVGATYFELNGVSDDYLNSLPKMNIHTQKGILGLIKSQPSDNLTSRVEKLIAQQPNEAIYLELLSIIDSKKAASYVLKSLNSSDPHIQQTAAKLAVSYGEKFAYPFITSLLQKSEIIKNDIKLAKSMVTPKNITKITTLWNNLSPEHTLALIEICSSFQNTQVAKKFLLAAEHEDSKVKKEALKTLKGVVNGQHFLKLKQMLIAEKSSSAARYIQAAIASSLMLADSATIKNLVNSLKQQRNEKLLAAFAKSNRAEVLDLLKEDIVSGSAEVQKETLKSLASMAPELSSKLLLTAIYESKDERNKILAARALAEAATNSTQPAEFRRSLLERALKIKLPKNEEDLLKSRLKKIPLPKKKQKKTKAKPSQSHKNYVPLFNGKDLDQWKNEGDYKVVNGVISGSNGKIWSNEVYENFSLRFEFKLEPGTNNGLAIRTPANQKPIELQIIDNPHPKYAKIKDYQRHGSLYGYMPAKTGFLKKAGEWNLQEVICDGSMVTVILNGTTILEADLSKVKSLPGNRYKINYINDAKKGHIGFLGHKAPIQFRAIEIKEL